jgi:endoplasmic reticulum lectin 1
MKNSQIFSLNEVSSCVYEAIVLTNQLCAHPAFQKPPPKEHEISCYTTKEQQSSKPMALNALEREASSQFFQEYSIFKGDSSTQSQINIFKQIFQFDANDIESGFQQLSAIIDAIKSKTKPDQNIVKETIGPKSTSSLIDSFWTGKICLHGGGGWWYFLIFFAYSHSVL